MFSPSPLERNMNFVCASPSMGGTRGPACVAGVEIVQQFGGPKMAVNRGGLEMAVVTTVLTGGLVAMVAGLVVLIL